MEPKAKPAVRVDVDPFDAPEELEEVREARSEPTQRVRVAVTSTIDDLYDDAREVMAEELRKLRRKQKDEKLTNGDIFSFTKMITVLNGMSKETRERSKLRDLDDLSEEELEKLANEENADADPPSDD